MKKLLAAIAIAIFFTLTPGRVFAAQTEAEGAGQLAAHFPVVDRRVDKLRAYLDAHNSPLTDEAQTFIYAADKYDLDWRLVAAIAGTESTFGQFIPTRSYNAWGWGVFTGMSYGAAFKNWADGIVTVSEGLRKNYINRGASTVWAIGNWYASSPAWAGHVQWFMSQIADFRQNTPDVTQINL